MFLLDTNVVSEMFKPAPDPVVAGWIRLSPKRRIYISAISKAEMLFGLAVMPQGKRKMALATAIRSFLVDELKTPILAFGEKEAELYADIASNMRKMGRSAGQSDAQIASIASSHGLVIVTRNVRHFANCGIDVLNPWEAAP